MRPGVGASFTANYRVGNGVAGNVARDSLVLLAPPAPLGNVSVTVTNPLPASGGSEPESIEHVRASAPWAFRTQQRAVTMNDYRDVVTRFRGVRRAAAELRWTGSWYTAFVTVERSDATAVDAPFKDALRGYLDGYRLAGYDVEIEDARRVPLLIEMHVCVEPAYVATVVEKALRDVFSAHVLPDGSKGVFHPDNFDLGGPIYLSPLYARAQAVDGVQSVTVLRFERQDAPDQVGLTQGFLQPSRFELLELGDDPNFPERGQFILHVDGGQ
jgi:predicted phage baseplate assembly protein